ncbi:MAG: hypothetical protein V1800_13165 [Candidatus Latescibacterota bacterium]
MNANGLSTERLFEGFPMGPKSLLSGAHTERILLHQVNPVEGRSSLCLVGKIPLGHSLRTFRQAGRQIGRK